MALAALLFFTVGGRAKGPATAREAPSTEVAVQPTSQGTVAAPRPASRPAAPLATAAEPAPPPPSATPAPTAAPSHAPAPPASASAEAAASTHAPEAHGEGVSSPSGARFPGSFLRNATEPTGYAAAEVDALVAELGRCTGPIDLVGHACSLGDEPTNQGMGMLRAEAVRHILIGRGVDGARIRVRTAGSQFPVADNENEGRRLVNRRVMVMCRTP